MQYDHYPISVQQIRKEKVENQKLHIQAAVCKIKGCSKGNYTWKESSSVMNTYGYRGNLNCMKKMV